MAEFTVKKSKKTEKAQGRTISISGEMTILHACQARDALLDVFTSEECIRIDVKGITSIDLAGMQLLCAAHRAALSANKTLVVDRTGNPVFTAATETAGFLRHVGCSQDNKNSCIWLGGNQWAK